MSNAGEALKAAKENLDKTLALSESLDLAVAEAVNEVDRLRNENERLRAALRHACVRR